MQMRLNVELDQYGVHFAHGDLRPVVVAAKDIDDVVAQPSSATACSSSCASGVIRSKSVGSGRWNVNAFAVMILRLKVG